MRGYNLHQEVAGRFCQTQTLQKEYLWMGERWVFVIIPICIAIPVFNLALALSSIKILFLQFLQVAVILFHHSIAIEDFRMTTRMAVERKGLAVVLRETVGVEAIANGIRLLKKGNEVVKTAINKQTAEEIISY